MDRNNRYVKGYIMFYPGMPDIYKYEKDRDIYTIFWYEGEFHFNHAKSSSEEEWNKNPSGYYDDVNELLLRMLQVAPYKDWKRVEIL